MSLKFGFVSSRVKVQFLSKRQEKTFNVPRGLGDMCKIPFSHVQELARGQYGPMYHRPGASMSAGR